MTDKWDTLHHSTEKGTNDWRTPREFFEKLQQRIPVNRRLVDFAIDHRHRR